MGYWTEKVAHFISQPVFCNSECPVSVTDADSLLSKHVLEALR